MSRKIWTKPDFQKLGVEKTQSDHSSVDGGDNDYVAGTLTIGKYTFPVQVEGGGSAVRGNGGSGIRF